MRRVTDTRGLRDIRSMVSSGARSTPRVQRSSFLDLYMLQKAKDRLDAEATTIAKRAETIRNRLNDIRLQMEALERSVQQRERGAAGGESVRRGPPNGGTQKQWKAFPAGY